MKIEAKRIVEVNPEDAVLLVNCDLPDDFDIEVARASGLIVTDNVEVLVLRGWRNAQKSGQHTAKLCVYAREEEVEE